MTVENSKSAYSRLKGLFTTIANLGGIGSLLNKESEVTMPKGSAADRDQQQMALATAIHKLITAPEVETWLDDAEKTATSLPVEDQRNLKLMRQGWIHSASLPVELSQELARLDSEGGRRHSEIHKSGDWSQMRDWYTHSFNTLRKVGEAKRDKLGVASTYEALLDQFSPGLRDATVASEFSALEKALAPLIAETVKKQKAEAPALPLPPVSIEKQDKLCRLIVTAMGFDFNRGRFDITKDTHPSSGGTSDYAWITARFKEHDFLDTLYAAIHEAGHAMYDQNQPETWRYQPAGSHLGMAIHETESMIWELQACKTPEFFRYLERTARDIFDMPDEPALSAANLQKLVTRVQPSFIRIEADEMTYPAHVVLRWRLEKSVIEGTLDPADLPRAWNEGLNDLLGITPPDNAKGCMQDVHWPSGAVGYFPAYTLGAMGAAQFFAAARKARPELQSEIEKGNFSPLKEWLRDNVHGKGSLLTPDELFAQATGEKLNARFYLNHLSERYLGRPWTTHPASQTPPAKGPQP